MKYKKKYLDLGANIEINENQLIGGALGGAGVVIIEPSFNNNQGRTDDAIILVQDANSNLYMIPGGNIDAGNTKEKTASKELAEETLNTINIPESFFRNCNYETDPNPYYVYQVKVNSLPNLSSIYQSNRALINSKNPSQSWKETKNITRIYLDSFKDGTGNTIPFNTRPIGHLDTVDVYGNNIRLRDIDRKFIFLSLNSTKPWQDPISLTQQTNSDTNSFLHNTVSLAFGSAIGDTGSSKKQAALKFKGAIKDFVVEDGNDQDVSKIDDDTKEKPITKESIFQSMDFFDGNDKQILDSSDQELEKIDERTAEQAAEPTLKSIAKEQVKENVKRADRQDYWDKFHTKSYYYVQNIIKSLNKIYEKEKNLSNLSADDLQYIEEKIKNFKNVSNEICELEKKMYVALNARHRIKLELIGDEIQNYYNEINQKKREIKVESKTVYEQYLPYPYNMFKDFFNNNN